MPDDLDDFFKKELERSGPRSQRPVIPEPVPVSGRVPGTGPQVPDKLDFNEALKGVISDVPRIPWNFLTSTVKNVGQGLQGLFGFGQNQHDILIDLNRLSFGTKEGTERTGKETGENFDKVMNMVTFGGYGALLEPMKQHLQDRYDKSVREGRGGDLGPEDIALSILGGGAEGAVDNLLGVKKIRESISGQEWVGKDPTTGQDQYRPLSSYERGQRFGEGVVNVGLAKNILKTGEPAGKLNELSADSRKILTNGQIAAKIAKAKDIPFEDALADTMNISRVDRNVEEIRADINEALGIKAGKVDQPITPEALPTPAPIGSVQRPVQETKLTNEGPSSTDPSTPSTETIPLITDKPTAPGEAPPTAKLQEINRVDEILTSESTIKFALSKYIESEAYAKRLLDPKNRGDEGFVPIGEAVVKFVRDGGIDHEDIANVMETNGLTPKETIDTFANSLRQTFTFHGQSQQALSELVESTHQQLIAQAMQGNKEAQAFVEKLGDNYAKSVKGGMLGWMSKLESWRKALIIGNIPTTMRIAVGQGLIGAQQLFGDAISGSIEAITGKTRSMLGLAEGKPLTSYFGDAISDFQTLGAMLQRSVGFGNEMLGRAKQGPELPGVSYPEPSFQKNPYEQLLNLAPLNKMQYRQPGEFDGSMGVLKNLLGMNKDPLTTKLLKTAPVLADLPARGADILTQFLTVGHRMTTFLGRSFFYESRLRANLDAAGMTIGDLMKDFQKEELPQQSHDIFVDALSHGLKQTMQYVPKDGFTNWVLNSYKGMGPLATAVLPTFPKFMMNTFRWQWEHSPAGLTNMFTPEFWRALDKGGLDARVASRTIGQAMTGVMMLNGAWGLQTGDHGIRMGPKYYNIEWDDKDGKIQRLDARSFVVPAPYLFMARALHSAATGEDMNLTPSELGDAITGVRSLSNVPIFAFQNVLEHLSKPDSKAWASAQKILGDYAASYFRPLKTLNDLFDPETHDLRGQELTGPLQASIPGASKSLPPAMNVFEGEPRRTESPVAHGLTGANVSSVTRLQEFVERVPGMSAAKVAGESYGSVAADRLIAEEMGKVFKTPVEGGGTLGDQIVDRFSDLKLSPDVQKILLEKIFTEIRHGAVQRAIIRDGQENGVTVINGHPVPRSFLNHYLNKIIPSVRGALEQTAVPLNRTVEP
jgi:hypothetical protein